MMARSQKGGLSKNGTAIMVVCGVPFILWILLAGRGARPAPSSLQEVKVDMHCHTTESDGDRTAEEQLSLAAKLGLTALWITDHDMIRDLDRTIQIQNHARQVGVEVSFGVEITVEWEKKEHHLLGYFPDQEWQGGYLSQPMSVLQAAVAKVKDSRENRNQMMVKFLNDVLGSESGKLYFETAAQHAAFTPLEVATVAKWAAKNANLMEPTSLGRPHFRAYLMQVYGVREDLIFGPRAGDGFATLASDNKVYYDDERTGKDGEQLEALMHSATLERRNIAFRPLPINQAIHLIKAANGRAVLAHPPTLGSSWATKFAPKVSDLKAAGLWGIEAFSSEISEENHAIIAGLARDNNLVMTGGSDNHGTLKIYAALGDVHRAGTDTYKELEYWARQGLKESENLRVDL